MFFRHKRSGRTEYLQIVKNERVDGKPRQSVVATLGRVDELAQDGTLERLLRSGARFAHSAVVLTAYERGEATKLATRQLGPALAFERLWQETGDRGTGRRTRVPVRSRTRGVSDGAAPAVRPGLRPRRREVASWAGHRWGRRSRTASALPRHGLARRRTGRPDRALPRPTHHQGPRRGAAVCRAQQPVQRTEPDVSRYHFALFRGRRRPSLGQYGHSKDHRPDLKQVVLAVVIDGRGRPICSELWPGNTTDVTTLLPVIERLKTRFLIARIGVVADRGMISATTVDDLEARNIDYILGVRERATKEVRGVIADPAGWVPLSIPEAADRGTTDLSVKE